MRTSSSGRFAVLASGSGGNAALIETPAGCVLIDFGLSPGMLDRRLKLVGLDFGRLRAVVLTHTHTDHWKAESLTRLIDSGIPIHTHPKHATQMARVPRIQADPKHRSLLRTYEIARCFEPIRGVSCLPIAVPHDSDPTVAFRFDGPGWAVGYASDLGTTRPDLLDAFDGINVLGLEFNHDVGLQRSSRRPAFLVERILGNQGHLSNDQAVDFLRSLIDRTGETLRHVVQLHLSRECNRPSLAAAAGRSAIRGTAVRLTTAGQDLPTPFVPLGPSIAAPVQPLLPGCES